MSAYEDKFDFREISRVTDAWGRHIRERIFGSSLRRIFQASRFSLFSLSDWLETNPIKGRYSKRRNNNGIPLDL